MSVKVNYDKKSGFVLGYYPDNAPYTNIPKPYIEISDQEHQSYLGKKMILDNGILREVNDNDLPISELQTKAVLKLKTIRDGKINTHIITCPAAQGSINLKSDQGTIFELLGIKTYFETSSNTAINFTDAKTGDRLPIDLATLAFYTKTVGEMKDNLFAACKTAIEMVQCATTSEEINQIVENFKQI